MTTTQDVRDAFDHLSTVETNTSELSDGIRVAVDESEIGQFYQVVRENDFEAQSVRMDGTLISQIEAEKSEGLGELFG